MAVTIMLLGNSAQWMDTGLVLSAGSGVHIQASGEIGWGATGEVAYPEGSYNGAVTATYDPSAVQAVGAAPSQNYEYPADWSIVPPYALALLILPDGTAPLNPPYSDGTHYTDRLLRPNRDTSYTSEQIASIGTGSGPWRLWAIFNDNNFTDNSSDFTVTFTQNYSQYTIKQGETKTFYSTPAYGGEPAAGDLWTIYKGGVRIAWDSISGADNRAGWAVHSGTGTLTVTAPNNATIANDYELRYKIDETLNQQMAFGVEIAALTGITLTGVPRITGIISEIVLNGTVP